MNFRPSVVVHFKNGDLKKGYTKNFSFIRETFDLVEVDTESLEEKEALQIQVEELKAVFFVKAFGGDPGYHPNPKKAPERYGFGERVEILFHDKELLVGYTQRYKKENNGFILYPADPQTNNEIIAVIRSATKTIKTAAKHSYFRQ